MSDAAEPVDLVVVGFGPTGAALAGLCARRGLSVVVVERDTEPFPLPRAVQCDHEALRVLQELGCADRVLDGSVLNDGIAFLTADRRTLLSTTVPPMAATGWPSSVFFHQPTFEAILRDAVVDAGAEVRAGVEVVAMTQDDDGVEVGLADGSSIRARFVVGCDGARSATRADRLGVARHRLRGVVARRRPAADGRRAGPAHPLPPGLRPGPAPHPGADARAPVPLRVHAAAGGVRGGHPSR